LDLLKVPDLVACYEQLAGCPPMRKLRKKIHLIAMIVYMETGFILDKERAPESALRLMCAVPELVNGELSVAGKYFSELVALSNQFPGVGASPPAPGQVPFRGSTKDGTVGLLPHCMMNLKNQWKYWIRGSGHDRKSWGLWLVSSIAHWTGIHEAPQCKRAQDCPWKGGGALSADDTACVAALRALHVKISKQYADDDAFDKRDPWAEIYCSENEAIVDDWFVVE